MASSAPHTAPPSGAPGGLGYALFSRNISVGASTAVHGTDSPAVTSSDDEKSEKSVVSQHSNRSPRSPRTPLGQIARERARLAKEHASAAPAASAWQGSRTWVCRCGETNWPALGQCHSCGGPRPPAEAAPRSKTPTTPTSAWRASTPRRPLPRSPGRPPRRPPGRPPRRPRGRRTPGRPLRQALRPPSRRRCRTRSRANVLQQTRVRNL